jgi:leucyl aminopeptidase
MKFKLEVSHVLKKRMDCVVVGVHEDGFLTPGAQKIDKLTGNFIQALVKKGNFQGKTGQTLILHGVPKLADVRVLLVGCGKNAPQTVQHYRKIIFASIKAILPLNIQRLAFFLTQLEVEKNETEGKISHAIYSIYEALYRFDRFKTIKDIRAKLEEVILYVTETAATRQLEVTIKRTAAIAEAVYFTKDIANLPSNICTPSYLAETAKTLVKGNSKLSLRILEEKEMQKLGMNAFLAVAKGSMQDAKLICIEYKGASKKTAPVVLVGKGITFDTGGISLKPADSMIGMKYDMCGAATVLGVLKAAAELNLPLNLVGILATAENMPSGTATKPEDIVVSLSGQTIEIMNTDAEGRLVLCDALTYCERYKPDIVIDIATLTGAVVVALGHHATAVLTNYQPLADDLVAAGTATHDRAWQMPLWDDYQEQLRSPFADMSNVGGRTAGTITAACFLSRFAKKFHWAHLDVAGTAAMMTGNDRYATGRPVPLLMQYLLNRCERKNAKN